MDDDYISDDEDEDELSSDSDERRRRRKRRRRLRRKRREILRRRRERSQSKNGSESYTESEGILNNNSFSKSNSDDDDNDDDSNKFDYEKALRRETKRKKAVEALVTLLSEEPDVGIQTEMRMKKNQTHLLSSAATNAAIQAQYAAAPFTINNLGHYDRQQLQMLGIQDAQMQLRSGIDNDIPLIGSPASIVHISNSINNNEINSLTNNNVIENSIELPSVSTSEVSKNITNELPSDSMFAQPPAVTPFEHLGLLSSEN
ncbi:MAG: hypothetical protein EZS28_016932 [Streblomastix strix]|uniref:Uncharacterized protein n=1 Tax=Streblomastix strix TaxID=222440 RepID=A0A5J4VY09_9EUKA|nr:MAG: hypothetical protein EZS28_016932 [Streblomastix strix]